jgi:hypothetical protein
MVHKSLKKNDRVFHKPQQILGTRPGDYELGSLESRAAARSKIVEIDRDHGRLTMSFGNLPIPLEFREPENVEAKAITLGNLPVPEELKRG